MATTHSIPRPTLRRIREIMASTANYTPGARWDVGAIGEDDRMILDGQALNAIDVAARWPSIRPDYNDGVISDPARAVVFGAIMSPDLWTDL